MTLDIGFTYFSNLALIGWLLLALFPWRKPWLYYLTGAIIPAILGIAYAVLMIPNFASAAAEGAGYGSLEQVSALFANEALLLAGWVHFLAFDLAVGTYIALQSDKMGLSRLIQWPILFMTLMFGPVGYLIFIGVKAASQGADTVFKGDVA